MSRLRTIPKASKESGIPYDTLLRLVNEKKITYVEIVGRAQKMLDMDDVEAFVSASKVASEAPENAQNRPPNTERLKPRKQVVTTDKHQWREEFGGRRQSCS